MVRAIKTNNVKENSFQAIDVPINKNLLVYVYCRRHLRWEGIGFGETEGKGKG